MDLRKLQGLLLDLISTRQAVSVDVIETMTEEHWHTLMRLVRQNRWAPLLHWRLTHERSNLTVPASVSVALARSFKDSTLRSLKMQRELLSTHRMLDASNIQHIFLKGAYLAFFSYVHPALRPLRDLDVLVSPARGLEAFQVLIKSGLTRLPKASGNPEATMDAGFHYPPLNSPHGDTTIELHGRLFHSDTGAMPGSDPADDPGYWARAITRKISGEDVLFASPTDLLFHLIVHAAYDHSLNNGPLTLSDIACLLHAEPIDWPLFWSLARDGYRLRGCLLLLHLSDHYYGPLQIDYQNQNHFFDEHHIIGWSALFLQHPKTRHAARVLDGSVSLSKRISDMFREFFPPRQKIAALYPVSPNSLQVYRYYLARWWWLLNKVRETVSVRHENGLHEESKAFVRLQQWLSQPE